MRISGRHLEGLARQIHEETGLGAPMDAFVLAEALDLVVKPWPKGDGMLQGNVIRYPGKAPMVRQQGTIAHECGHEVIGVRNGLEHDEDDADYMAGALMLPRPTLHRDLDRFDWDLFRIHEQHPNASWQMLVIRCVQVGSAAGASIWDAGKCHRTYGDVDRDAHRELVLRVLETGVAERGEVDAYPVFTPGFRRVVCLANTPDRLGRVG